MEVHEYVFGYRKKSCKRIKEKTPQHLIKSLKKQRVAIETIIQRRERERKQALLNPEESFNGDEKGKTWVLKAE